MSKRNLTKKKGSNVNVNVRQCHSELEFKASVMRSCLDDHQLRLSDDWYLHISDKKNGVHDFEMKCSILSVS